MADARAVAGNIWSQRSDVLVAIAAKVGPTRLIDNTYFTGL